MIIPKAPGVYCIRNKINNKVYVGSAKDLNARIGQHFSSKCHNPHLKSSIKKHGKESFSVTWHETEDLFQEEQRLLDYVFTLEPGATFNVAVKAGGGRVLKDYTGFKELCEAKGGPKSIPLFLICTVTGLTTKIESACEGERLGLGPRRNISTYSKLDCLGRVKTCLVAQSEAEARAKLKTWLLIPGNTTIDTPIVLALPGHTKQSALYKKVNVSPSHFSRMYHKVLRPNTGEPLYSAIQSKADFVWHGTEVKAGDWFRCTK